MTGISLLSPLVAFSIVLAVVWLLSRAVSHLAFRRGGAKGRYTPPYACGEDLPNHLMQPNCGQVLPFAFFFTILHVTALMVTTVPVETPTVFTIAVVYVLGAAVGLFVLYGER